MMHISYEDWVLYVKDQLDEETRERYDTHLFECDQCLSTYMEVIEAQEQQLPVMQHDEAFTDAVMVKINQQQVTEKKMPVSKFYQKPAFHYVLAAAMTLFLMSTGVFSHLMNIVSDFEANKKNEPSVVEGFMKNKVSFIDKEVQKKSEQEEKK